MKSNKYKQTPTSQLREYVLVNRQDIEALKEYMNRPGKISKSLSYNATREEITKVLQQIIDR